MSKSRFLRQAKDEANSLHAALKEGKDPSDPGVEALRRSLRDQYLAFLFAGRSLSARAGDVVNLMWLECSHALIKRHRDRIAKIDADLDKSVSLSRRQRSHAYKSSGEGTVTRRKLIHGLRVFLTQEEGFWASLICRIIDTFHVERARPAALFLKFYRADEIRPAESQVGESDHALALVQTALVFYGDLARYSELYREPSQKDRRFERASECYHQARLLMPSSGQPDHQLAVIASGRKDLLAAAFHYMRALAVRSSFATARPNLETTYKQAIAHYRSTKDQEDVELGDVGAQTIRTFVVTLALLVVQLSVPPSPEEIEKLVAKNRTHFISALETRTLSSENIIKIFLLAVATWWDTRLGNDVHNEIHTRIEDTLLKIILDILIALFTVSTNMTEASLEASLAQPSTGGMPAALAARISAPVRRIAPALRIASLWMLGNLDQIARAASKDEFWTSYNRLVDTLVTAFPPDALPSLPSGCNLEEDFELLSFLPCPLPPGNAPSPYIADHPNSEFLFRIHSFLSDATLASSQSTVVQQSFQQPSAALEVDPRLSLVYEDDADILTEAMDAARLSSTYSLDQEGEDDDEDEILYQPHGLRHVPSPVGPPSSHAATTSAGPTAQDLLSNLLRGESALPPQPNIWSHTPTTTDWSASATPGDTTWQMPAAGPRTWPADLWPPQQPG